MPFDHHSHLERRDALLAIGRTVHTFLTVVAATTSLLVGTAAAERSGAELDAANSRWRGARCRTRQMIELKKGSDKDGWTKSRWLWWGEPHSNERARVWVSDSDAVRRAFGGIVLPIGTELVANGWTEENGDLFLELELARAPVAVKVFFWDDWVGRVSSGRIDDFERWARFELLEIVASPEEELVDVSSPAPVPAAPSTVPAQPFPPPPHASQPLTLRVLSTSVEPARVTPGQEVLLIAVYELGGLAAGVEIEVNETRTIRRDGQQLTTIDGRVDHAAGAHESRQSLRLPSTIASGIYELEVTIAAAGLKARKAAIFEVR